MSLHRLLFDAANPDDSANVGAHLRAGTDGTLIGSVSDALKVNFTNTTIAVTATDLDIRDLAFATDSVDVSGSSVSITGNVNVTQGTSPWVVSATDLDIRDLAAATDSVASWLSDGTGNAITSTSGALDVNIANAGEISIDFTHNTAMATSAESVTTTSGALITSPLANRENVFIYNNGSKDVFIGPSGVTTANGFPLFTGSILEAKIGPAVAIHAVAESGTQELRVMQLS